MESHLVKELRPSAIYIHRSW